MARRFDILINAKDKNAAATFRKVAGAMAAMFSANIIKNQIAGIVNLGDEIGKTATRIGTTAEEFQKFAFAARRGGATGGDVEKAFKRMASTIFDANRGIKESVEGLEDLGLTADDLRGKNPARQFELIADGLNRITDASDKAALAQDVFGKAGTALIPMLGNYKELGKELERMGGIIANENVKAAEDFKDAMEDLSTTIKAVVANSGLIKWLANVSRAFVEVQNDTKKWRHLLESFVEVVEEFATGKDVDLTQPLDFDPQFDAPTKRQVRKANRERKEKIVLGAKSVVLNIPPDAILNEFEKRRRFRDEAETFQLETVPAMKFKEILQDILPTGPQQAFVTRGLSGLGTTMKPANETAANTKNIANAATETNNKLDTMIAPNAQALANFDPLAPANLP